MEWTECTVSKALHTEDGAYWIADTKVLPDRYIVTFVHPAAMSEDDDVLVGRFKALAQAQSAAEAHRKKTGVKA